MASDTPIPRRLARLDDVITGLETILRACLLIDFARRLQVEIAEPAIPESFRDDVPDKRGDQPI